MNTPVYPIDPAEFKRQLHTELTDNILPFWLTYVPDKEHGGFYGAVTNDLQIHNDVPRSSTLCARILWTFAHAYRRFGAAEYLDMAREAYRYLTHVFWDAEHGGLYWSVDFHGQPVEDRKQHYAQAFGIYGLTEYYQATQDPESLTFAQNIYHLLETHAAEPQYGGYIEGCRRDWGTLADQRLSAKDLNSRKSMNTLLHILEAYTNLLRVWPDPQLQVRQRALLQVFLEHVVDQQTGHFKLFFDDAWQSLSDHVSYGHDIEGSWLLWEAVEVLDDHDLQAQTQTAALKLAAAVYQEGLDTDGSVFYEGDPQGIIEFEKAWWPQAEAMVGFYNAYQLTGAAHFAQAAYRCWAYIQAHLIDRTYGDWYKQLDRDGKPDHGHYKAGPWDCPYHHSRACFELLTRLPRES